MLSFERYIDGGSDRVETAIDTLVVAGWTGRDEAALRHHIEELAAIGVPRPSSVPVFYRISVANLTQADSIEVLGTDTSGEAEPVLVSLPDGINRADVSRVGEGGYQPAANQTGRAVTRPSRVAAIAPMMGAAGKTMPASVAR